MARVKLSPLLVDISGSIGAATFQRSQAGLTIRSKPFHKPAGSQEQINTQLYMAQAIKGWHDLTDTQRTNWKNYNTFAPNKTIQQKNKLLSPYQLWLKYQLIRLRCGLELLSNINWAYTLDYEITPTVDVLGSVLNFDAGEEISLTTRWLMLKLSTPQLATVNNPRNLLRCIPLAIHTFTSQDISYLYIQALKTFPVLNDLIFMEITIFSSVAPIIYHYPAVKITVIAS